MPANDMPGTIYDRLVSLKDFSEALSLIKHDIDAAQEVIDRAERYRTPDTHFQAALALSGLEIKMTNFAKSMRERFV